MTRPLLSLVSLILAIGLSSGFTHAQQNNSTKENAQSSDALRAKAFNLLESLAGQINGLQSAENRARLGSNIAESLWNHDEKRARSLFASVEDDIKTGLHQNREGEAVDEHTLRVFLRLRMDTVERIGKHDAVLALSFLEATELKSDTPHPYGVESERTLRLRLAKEIAADNPDLALKLGRQSLGRDFSDDLLSLLRQLNKKHRDQGLLLHREIIAKLRSANLATDWGAMYFAQNLVLSFAPPAADESTYRELINILIASALSSGCGNKMSREHSGYFCGQVASLLPQIERIDPASAARLKQLAPRILYSAVINQAYKELSDLNENATVDEILALTPKYPQIAGQIYWQAMTKALGSGDVERARRIATDYNGDPEERRRMLAQIERDQMWASMNDEKLAEVQRRLSSIPRVQDRIELLVYISHRLGANDKGAAVKLLNQASGIVDTMKPGKEQTEARMGLAMLYCLEGSDRGFAIMESLLPKLNDLVEAAAKLDGFETRYLRDGEWNMTGEGNVGSLLTRLAQNAGYFAWCDFDRAVSLAAQFERPEIRLMAQLKLAQGILAGPPKRLAFTAPPRN